MRSHLVGVSSLIAQGSDSFTSSCVRAFWASCWFLARAVGFSGHTVLGARDEARWSLPRGDNETLICSGSSGSCRRTSQFSSHQPSRCPLCACKMTGRLVPTGPRTLRGGCCAATQRCLLFAGERTASTQRRQQGECGASGDASGAVPEVPAALEWVGTTPARHGHAEPNSLGGVLGKEEVGDEEDAGFVVLASPLRVTCSRTAHQDTHASRHAFLGLSLAS